MRFKLASLAVVWPSMVGVARMAWVANDPVSDCTYYPLKSDATAFDGVRRCRSSPALQLHCVIAG
jgi:hypothetical protein